MCSLALTEGDVTIDTDKRRWVVTKKSDILQSLPHAQLLSSKTQINVYCNCDFNDDSQDGVHVIFVSYQEHCKILTYCILTLSIH